LEILKNSGRWCRICSGRPRYTIEDCKEFAKTKDGKCLSTTYKNANTKIKWFCNKCNYIWKNTFSHIKGRGQWCPKCSGTIKNTIEECRKENNYHYKN